MTGADEDLPANGGEGSAQPAMSIAEADAMLTGPGGFFEIVAENVNGIEMGVVAGPHRSLRDLLAASANHGGDGSARYYLFDDGRSATFAENIGHTAAVAAGLADRYGIGPGDRVGLLGANQPGWIQGFWGTVSAGAIAVAMNGWWKGDEIRYGIELTEPKVLIADRRRLERLEGDPGVPVIGIDADPEGPADSDGGPDTVNGLIDAYRGASMPDREIAIDDPAAILFTSGTTGRPRGAIQTHRNFFAYLSCAFMIGARQFVRFPGETMNVGGPTLACSPLFHVSGLHACAVMAVGAGFNHLWTTGRYDAEKILRLTEEHGIARWSGVTTQVWRLVEHPRLRDYDVSSVVSIGGGGLGVVAGVAGDMPHRPAPCPRQRDHRIRAHREFGAGHQRGRRCAARPSRLGRLPAPHRQLAHHRRRRHGSYRRAASATSACSARWSRPATGTIPPPPPRPPATAGCAPATTATSMTGCCSW